MAAGRTLAEKIIARAAGRPGVRAGEIATCAVDLAFAHDSSGPRRWKPLLEELGLSLWDPAKVVLASDHYVPAVDADSAAILKLTRDFARDQGVARFFDMQGIAHTLLPQNGLLKPGMFVAGGDSHSPHGGAFGCFIAGYGATDMAAIVATGETWVLVPETDRVVWSGAFQDGVVAKDVMLMLCRALGMDNAFKVIEYAGPTIDAMAMDERMTLTNMSAELGYDTGLIAPDETTLAHIRAHGGAVEDDALSWRSDDDADFAATYHFDASKLSPQVAAPHSPANADSVRAHAGVKIDQAYIGACVGAKLEDLRMAARVLQGRKVAAGVRLLVAPASTHIAAQAAKEGVLETLMSAGAHLMPSGCGACAGMGAGLLAAGETCISTTNRNFKGRMGHNESDVWLASPYTVAASAVAGVIVDPREMLGAAARDAA
ncbi:MAG: 3-isopropylmalate dehydratase large subunit [Hyphomonadaceae bacterium]|nr:3-isopropylmalate dehydratase large subunit [Hyphomonadaceae bacterium]